jgi:hypothetical protein
VRASRAATTKQTQNVPIEELSEKICKEHWLWSRVTAGAAREQAEGGAKPVVAKAMV